MSGKFEDESAGGIAAESLPKRHAIYSQDAPECQDQSFQRPKDCKVSNRNSLELANDALEEEKTTPEPDGGFQAWSQVFMGHLMNFNTWGYINSYGLFQSHYTTSLGLPTSTISWIGSIQIFLLCFIGAFSGRALDAGYYRHVLVLGCFLQVFGIFMTSLCTEYWQIILAQGVCSGLGHGLVFSPTVGLVATYFVRHRSLAVAIVTGGSGTGGIVFVLLAQKLFPTLGFSWTVRIMGFIVLFNAIIIISLAKPRLPPRKVGAFFAWNALKERPYALFVVGMFLTLWPVYYDFTYINIFATNTLHIPTTTSLTFLLIINAVGLPGRVIPALLADRLIGPLNTLIILSILCALFNYVWISFNSTSSNSHPSSSSSSSSSSTISFSIFVAFFGLINGGVQGIFLAALSTLTPPDQLDKMGMRSGLVMTIIAFSTLTGAPIAGALIDQARGGFLGVQVFGGTVMLLGCVVTIAARAAKTGWVVRQSM